MTRNERTNKLWPGCSGVKAYQDNNQLARHRVSQNCLPANTKVYSTLLFHSDICGVHSHWIDTSWHINAQKLSLYSIRSSLLSRDLWPASGPWWTFMDGLQNVSLVHQVFRCETNGSDCSMPRIQWRAEGVGGAVAPCIHLIPIWRWVFIRKLKTGQWNIRAKPNIGEQQGRI